MTNKDLAVYPAIFFYENEGVTVTFPDLPGCITCGETEEEAIYMAKDALGCFITACEALGDTIPQPSKPSDVVTKDSETVFLVDAWLPIFREEKRMGSVKKNVTVPVWLNSLAEKANLNFSQILQAGIKSSLGIREQ
ncbi:MAG: type II toxin-antitoxin system HicB family antitoxin [Synergistaceae bacterium]